MEKKSLKDNNGIVLERSRLSILFEKYRIDLFYHRNYKNTARFKNIILIFIITTVSIFFGIVLARIIAL